MCDPPYAICRSLIHIHFISSARHNQKSYCHIQSVSRSAGGGQELGSAYMYHEVTHTNTILLEQSQGHSLSYLCLVLCCQLFDHRLVAGLWKEVCYWLSMHCISLTCVAFFQGLVTTQFLIACSEQNEEGRPTDITWGITLSIHLERGPECNNLSFPSSMSWTTSGINAALWTLWLQALGWRLYKKAINPLLGLLPR